nr:hypothetical protein [Xanthomonas vasicola]MDO6933642.1 hypothetical protein [Xanthomonas vasicola]MDO6937234.1 hypothetical protein [Xanthomonas vasicola]MDO6947502.1 hypothetical protein [Xanthomonas vasicola]MDO6950572.1 hypothetical protein [Xanthomonas vasicola]MDO6956638.1 hypothetical protein [Xanthomonas vasicola]
MESLISAFDCLIAMALSTLLRTPLTCTASNVDVGATAPSVLGAACCAAALQLRARPMHKLSGRLVMAWRAKDACCDEIGMRFS